MFFKSPELFSSFDHFKVSFLLNERQNALFKKIDGNEPNIKRAHYISWMVHIAIQCHSITF